MSLPSCAPSSEIAFCVIIYVNIHNVGMQVGCPWPAEQQVPSPAEGMSSQVGPSDKCVQSVMEAWASILLLLRIFPSNKELYSSKSVLSPWQSWLCYILCSCHTVLSGLVLVLHHLFSWCLLHSVARKQHGESQPFHLKVVKDVRCKEGDVWPGESSGRSWCYLGMERPLLCHVTAQVQLNIVFVTMCCQRVTDQAQGLP